MDDNVKKSPDSSKEAENLQTQKTEAVQETPSILESSESLKEKASIQDKSPVNNADESKQKKPNKKKILIAAISGIVLIVLAIAIGVGIYSSKPHTADEWLELGNKYLLEMNYEKAIVAFNKVIEIEPKNIPARLGLAQAYMGLERYGEAEAVLFEILEIDSSNVDAYNALMSLALKYSAIKQYSNAEALYLKLLNYNKRNSGVYIALQDLYELMGDFSKLSTLLEEMRNLGLEEYILFGEVIGKIIDGTGDSSDSIPISDVRISIQKNKTSERTLQTDGNGMYTILLRSGQHEQTAEKTGYIPFNQEIEVTANETLYMPTMELIPVSDGIGSVSGQIIDSITGRGIQGASIEMYDQSQNKITDIYTDGNGYYEFSSSAGYYRAKVSSVGYTNTQRDIAIIGSYNSTNRDLTMTPILQDGEIRIVLTWGRYPEDLDSHLFGPYSQGGNFHIYYSDKEAHENGILMAFLDLDDTDSYGPETTTIYRAVEGGTYSFVVLDYTNRGSSGSSALANSSANIKVYVGNDSMREYNVPPGLVGDTWYVFDIVNGELKSPSTSTWDWSGYGN